MLTLSPASSLGVTYFAANRTVQWVIRSWADLFQRAAALLGKESTQFRGLDGLTRTVGEVRVGVVSS